MTIQTATVDTAHGIDRKRMLWLLSPAMPLFAVAALCLAGFGGMSWAYWALPALFYIAVPILDYLLGEYEDNIAESARTELEADHYYRKIVSAFVPLQYAATILGAWLAVTGNLTVWEMAGLIMSAGVVQGLGINTGHELGHKRKASERWLAKLTLAPSMYGHFVIEHNKGHHKHVATPIDPASSRMGETLWAFLPRTMLGSLKSAWAIEANRLKRSNEPVISLKNENIQAWLISAALFGGLALWLGPIVLPYLMVSGLIGAVLLEIVNYIEHYGLLRQKTADGRYERCAPRHSWNNNHVVSNLLLYQLQRHSDHHANPTRSFQALRHFEDSPQLPAGYTAMVVIALFPPLWFYLMDKKVAAHWGYDMTLAHLHESKRDALMKRWHKAPSKVAQQQQTEQPTHPSQDVSCSQHQCSNCDYVYDESIGAPKEGYPAGTRWMDLPDSWSCPDCAVRDKADFKACAMPKPVTGMAA